jgi:hypothetical protein
MAASVASSPRVASMAMGFVQDVPVGTFGDELLGIGLIVPSSCCRSARKRIMSSAS